METTNLSRETIRVTEESQHEPFIQGPRGAFILSLISAGILFIGWLLFYFLIFMRRGYVG